MAEQSIRQSCTLNSIFNYLRLRQVPASDVDYCFVGLDFSQRIRKGIYGINQMKRPIAIVDRGESLKNRVYRHVVAQIEETYVEGFPILKKEFCERNRVALL
jgi:hypothetical protein